MKTFNDGNFLLTCQHASTDCPVGGPIGFGPWIPAYKESTKKLKIV